MKTCEICDGARTIRLPVRRRLVDDILTPRDAARPLTATEIAQSYRTFPCPACADAVHEDRIKVLTTGAEMWLELEYENDERYREYCRQQLAHQLVGELLRDRMITFETGRLDKRTIKRQFVATLGVVAPQAVENIQTRILAGAQRIANKVVELAGQRILQWGSAYSGASGPIEKAKALVEIKGAFKDVIADETRQLHQLKLNSVRTQ